MSEVAKKIFYEFYSSVIKDIHSSRFFNSKEILDNLIERQSSKLQKMIKLLSIGDSTVEKEFAELAYLHYKIGLSEKALFDAIEIYINLLKKYRNELAIGTELIEKFAYKLKESTARIYAIHYLQTALKGLAEHKRVLEKSDFYHNILVFSLEQHYQRLIRYLEGKDVCFEERGCEFSKFIKSFAFDVIALNPSDTNLTVKIKHTLLHKYMREFVDYFEERAYFNALIILQKFLSLAQEVLNTTFLLFHRFSQESVDLLAQELESHENLSLFIMTIQKDKNLEIVKKYLRNFLELYFKETTYNFFIFVEKDDTFLLVFNPTYPNFEEEIEKFLEKANRVLQKELSYLTLQTPYYHIAKIDFFRIEATQEEIKKVYKLIEKELTQTKSDKFLYFKDFTPKLSELLKEAKEQLALEKRVLAALAEEEVELFIHQMFDEKEQIVGGEVLARIKDEDGSYIPAFRFISFLEEKELMQELDRIILKKAYQKIERLKELSNGNLFINIYPKSLANKEVADSVVRLSEICNKKGMRLFLELTEYAVTANRVIYELLERADGIFLAFDDFGTGYTNYELVGELVSSKNAKALKIDGSLVKKIDHSKIHYSIVASISEFASDLEMIIVYEFVENEKIFQTLQKLVHKLNIPPQRVFYQGWFFDQAQKV